MLLFDVLQTLLCPVEHTFNDKGQVERPEKPLSSLGRCKETSLLASKYDVLAMWQSCVREYATGGPNQPDIWNRLRLGYDTQDCELIFPVLRHICKTKLNEMHSTEIERFGLQDWFKLREIYEDLPNGGRNGLCKQVVEEGLGCLITDFVELK